MTTSKRHLLWAALVCLFLACPAFAATDADDVTMDDLQAIRQEAEASWEHAFPISLQEALEIALSGAPTIAISEAETRAAEIRKDATKSDYRPNLSISAGIELNKGSGYVAGSNQLSDITVSRTAATVNASISASQLIYDFGAHRANRKGAEADLRGAYALEEQLRQDLRTQVITQYLQAGAAREKWLVAQKMHDAELQRARQIDAKVEVGLRPYIDLATARSNVANATSNLVKSSTDYDVAVYNLLAAMGVTQDKQLDITYTDLETDALEQLNTDALLELATNQHGDFRSLAASLEATQEAIRGVNAERLPSLMAVAGASESYLIGDTGRWNLYIGARLSWDLYRGGRITMDKRQQEAQRDIIIEQQKALVIDTIQRIHRLQREIKGAKVLVKTQKIVTENAAKQLELADARYDTGLGDIVELSDAQLAFTQAQNDEIDARLSLSLRRAELISTVAGWDAD